MPKRLLVFLLATAMLAAQIPPPPGTPSTEQIPVLIDKPSAVPGVPIANQPVAVFSESGTWGGLSTYNWSICNSTERNISIYGSAIWAQAQRQGLRILTHAQANEHLTHYNRQSGWAIMRTVLLAASGVTSGLQAGGVLGEKWQDGYKAIAPAIGTVLTIVDLSVTRHEEKLELPADYLPVSIQIPPGGCEFGRLIGAP